MGSVGIIVPHIAWHYEIVVRSQYDIWRRAAAEASPEFKIENVRFPHDPNWRNNFWSVQAAHDGKNGWVVVRYLYIVAGLSPYVAGWFS